ncbi:MAG: hypothetical protein PHI18_09190 [bacterium]|nr:hypothetical protein [bacterium]
MTERKSKSKLEAATAEPLVIVPVPVDKNVARRNVLDVLYSLAREGNVSAAKLFLDCLSDEEPDREQSLTAEAALAILSEQTKTESSS